MISHHLNKIIFIAEALLSPDRENRRASRWFLREFFQLFKTIIHELKQAIRKSKFMKLLFKTTSRLKTKR